MSHQRMTEILLTVYKSWVQKVIFMRKLGIKVARLDFLGGIPPTFEH